MAGQVTLSVERTSIFDPAKFAIFLRERNASTKVISNNEYQQGAWLLDGVNIIQYEKKIVIQGKIGDHHSAIIRSICGFEGLTLDQNNKDILSSLFPKQHNAIVCGRCSQPSISIEADVQGLEIKFKRECSHFVEMNSPLLMINNRILPDINMLVSQSLSRLIGLGHFVGFEVVIPRFVMNVVDTFGAGKKSSVSTEIAALRALESAGKIHVKDIIDPYADISKFLAQEDNIIIDISDTTNAILVTSDRNMKSKAQIRYRPVIFIPPEIHASIKTAYEVRT